MNYGIVRFQSKRLSQLCLRIRVLRLVKRDDTIVQQSLRGSSGSFRIIVSCIVIVVTLDDEFLRIDFDGNDLFSGRQLSSRKVFRRDQHGSRHLLARGRNRENRNRHVAGAKVAEILSLSSGPFTCQRGANNQVGLDDRIDPLLKNLFDVR